MKKVIIIFLLFICSLANAETQIIFRYDDFSADTKESTQKRSLRTLIREGEISFDRLFSKYNVPYVIAVIPNVAIDSSNFFNIDSDQNVSIKDDPDKIKFLKTGLLEGRIEVAQHGYIHLNHSKKRYVVSEFYGRDSKIQKNDIYLGHEILIKALNMEKIYTFIPPFFTWDNSTRDAVKNCSFNIISADRSSISFKDHGITFIPYTALLEDMEKMISENTIPHDSLIVIVYHPADIAQLPGNEHLYFGKQRMEGLLKAISLNKNLSVVTFKDIYHNKDDVNSRAFCASLLWKFRSFYSGKLIPEKYLPGADGNTCLLHTDKYKLKIVFWSFISMLLFIAIFITGYKTNNILADKLPSNIYYTINILSIFILFIFLFFIIEIYIRGYNLTAYRFLPFLLCLSLLISFILKFKQKRKITN